MKYISFLFISVLLIAQFSCTQQASNHGEDGITHFVLDDINRLDKSDMVFVDVLPLETINENLMGQDLRIRKSEDYFFVFDESIQDGIHQFDNHGNYIGRKAIVGEGPNTLSRLIDFYVSRSGKLEVLNPVGGKAQVFNVNQDNTLDLKFTVEYNCSSFTKLPNGEYLFYGSYNLPFVSHRLVRTDSTGVILEKYLENNYSNQMLPLTERNFFMNGDEVKFIESFNNIGYTIKNDQFSPDVSLDFRKYSIPSKFWELDLMEGGFELLSKNGFANLHAYFTNDTWSMVSVHLQKPEGIFKDIIFYNKKSSSSGRLSTSFSDDFLFHYPIGIEDNKMLFLTYRSLLIKDYGSQLSESLTSKVPEMEYDYPVILYVETKLENI